jgi:hypothetical protein
METVAGADAVDRTRVSMRDDERAQATPTPTLMGKPG